jgi:putative membrane protein
VLNAIVKPLLVILTLPITIITLGLFLLVINAAIILLGDYFLEGFKVDGFWWALLFSILLSVVSSILYSIGKKEA